MEIEYRKANTSLADRRNSVKINRLRVAAYCRVSTDGEDQINSYRSQILYYTDLIKKNKEWELAGIYADEGITGTQTKKREQFVNMINDCMAGKIDMVITKSITRFARNTVDTLQYVRMLKERNIAVFFEIEKINTLTMDGELLLTVLSSVAQQEVHNISSNVKKGLYAKMKRGEMVGFNGCLGYDYDIESKTLSLNEEEAETVKYIFNRYIQGAGGRMIANELNSMGRTTKLGNKWSCDGIVRVIKNEKYQGDMLAGKTFTIDPISKRRIDNWGEADQYYIRDHHEPIVSREVFEKAQTILEKRSSKLKLKEGEKRNRYTRQYAFSCMLECGFCGSNLSRRSWHSGEKHQKTIWQCVTGTKKGKRFCPDSKGIPESAIEEAFVKSYQMLCNDNQDVMDEFIERIEKTLGNDSLLKKKKKAERDYENNERRQKKLVDLQLDNMITREVYDKKYKELKEKADKLLKEIENLKEQCEGEEKLKLRINDFKRVLSKNKIIVKFDRHLFENVVEKVIIGGIDEEGNKDPYKITFVYRTGMKDSVKAEIIRKKSGKKCSHDIDQEEKECSCDNDDTCRDGSFDEQQKCKA